MRVNNLEILRCDAGCRNYHFVKLTTDEGIVGWSEFDEGFGSPGVTAVIERMAHGTPSALAFASSRVFSIALSPSATTPHAAGRVKQ